MKYFITYFLLIIVLLYGQVIETDFPLIVNIILILLILAIPILWEYSVFKKNFKADLKIRSQRKTIKISPFLLAVFWTFLLFFNALDFKNNVYPILFLWSLPLAELVMWFIYKKKKPYTIFINDNVLILNNLWTQKRNIIELKQIRFDRFSKKLQLDFKSKYEISIKTTDYKAEDIKLLLKILIEKSENEVFVPQNFELKTNN